MQTPQQKLKDIKRLLSAFPAASQADPTLMLHNYLTAVDDWPAVVVSDAVELFIKGNVPNFDGRFAPTAPQLGSACRAAQEAITRANYLGRIRTPALPPPDIKHTPEEQERARAKVQGFIESVAAADLHVRTEDDKRRRERFAKVHERFDPPQDDASISQRLLGYSVGSPESDDAAA